jgi:hypothetical protein
MNAAKAGSYSMAHALAAKTLIVSHAAAKNQILALDAREKDDHEEDDA